MLEPEVGTMYLAECPGGTRLVRYLGDEGGSFRFLDLQTGGIDYYLSVAAAGLLAPVSVRQLFDLGKESASRAEVLMAWRDGELSEGQACALTGLDSLALREAYQEAGRLAQERWRQFRTLNTTREDV